MRAIRKTLLWLVMLTTVAAMDSFLSDEDAKLERVLTILKQQEHTIKQLQTTVDGFNQKNKQQEHRIEQLETTLERLEQKKEYVARNTPIAFTAALSTTFSGGGNNAVVPYDTIMLNHGEAYSTEDYHFTAPVRGLYWFTVSMFAKDRGRVHLSHNGNRLASAEDGNNFYGGDAVSTILMLEAQDRVACSKQYDTDVLREDGSTTPSLNLFAGFLYAAF